MRRTKRLIGMLLGLTMILGGIGTPVKATESGEGLESVEEMERGQDSLDLAEDVVGESDDLLDEMGAVVPEQPADSTSEQSVEPTPEQPVESMPGQSTEAGPLEESVPEQSEEFDRLEAEQIENSWRYTDGEWTPPSSSNGQMRTRAVSREEYEYAWQKVNGKYMNSNGKPIEGVIAKGMDVSQWQYEIDWERVRKTDIDFAILRCAYGKNASSQDDRYFAYNVQECKRLSIPFGVYLYSYAMDVEAAVDEAEHVLRVLKENKIKPSDMKYPVFYDLENSKSPFDQTTLTEEERGDIAEAFCNVIIDAGYSVGIYANTYWFNNYLTDSRFEKWDKWVAQYNHVCTYQGEYAMWQATSSGTVDGIEGSVDLNFDFYFADRQTDGLELVVENGKTYLYEYGVMARSKEAVVNGQWKWFDADGTMAVSKDVYIPAGNKWVRYDANGNMIKGWNTNKDGMYYFDPFTGEMCKGIKKFDGKYYFFYQITGVMVEAKSKELVIDGEWRWFDADGTIAVSKDVYIPDGKKWVRYNAEGAMVKGWDWTSAGTYYFDKITGEMLKGWQWLPEGLFYFDEVTGIRQ